MFMGPFCFALDVVPKSLRPLVRESFFLPSPLCQSRQQFPGRDDFDAERFAQDQQVFVPGDDKTGRRRQRARKVGIVFCVAAALLSLGSGGDHFDCAIIPIEDGVWRIPGLKPKFVHHALQFRDGFSGGESEDTPPSQGQQAQISLASPACARENNSGVKHDPHFQRPFLATA